MASNFFGQIFRISTFGESHGPAIGVVIDGCPAGLSLSKQDIDEDLSKRQGGNTTFTTPRKEKDEVEILSGLFDGKTTGAPIAILIRNKEADSSQYDTLKSIYRPGHANFTYLEKYKIFDHRGGGRASARETVARVAAGAIAKKMLAHFHIECLAFLSGVGEINTQSFEDSSLLELRKKIETSSIFCPDSEAEIKMIDELKRIQKEKDSIGGIVTCIANIPSGLGDPIYNKLEANLAFAMLSIPASKGFEIGSGFAATRMKGSEHNDPFDIDQNKKVILTSNRAGGVLGGISTGSPLIFRVPFKPTSSIRIPQNTVNLQKEKTALQMPETGRHDLCVAIRAVPVIEAMTAIVLADALLMNRCVRVD